ncbi:MAG: sigma 54-interacting transcriptional regulator [bacterium]|nr:sigma 54-interacting transcriptional regulator [bacterium]
MLAGYFLLLAVFHFGHLFAFSIPDPVGRWGWYLVATGVFSAIFKTRFVYHVPRNSFPREERIVFYICVALVGSAWIEYLIRAGLGSVFYHDNQNFGSPFVSTSLPIVLFLVLIWSIIVLVRQYFRRAADNRAALIFVGLTAIELLLTIFVILERAAIIPTGPETTEMVMNFSLVILYFLYALFYLNLTSEPSSFIVKLVGISLVTLVTVISALGVRQVSQADAAYDRSRGEDARLALQRHSMGQTVNIPERLEREASGHGHPGAIRYIVRVNSEGRAALVYSLDPELNLPAGSTPDGGAPGTAGRRYRQIDNQIYLAFQVRPRHSAPDAGDALYEVAFDYLAYRQHIHSLARSYGFAIVLTILFMLIVFPLFFRATVTAPLQQLLGRLQEAGLRRDENHNQPEDDLAFLSRSFTQMTKLLKDAKSRFYEFSDHIQEVEQSVESYGRDEPIVREVGDRNILYASRAMRDVIAQADRFAVFDQPVLVTGETGTGKELIARLIHHAGPRKAAPFIDINCAAIAASLWESEVFGHVRGAFTDASSSRPGRVAEADEGTLFFDEIGEMPLEMQAKMLRLLQERTYRPVGGNSARPARCRFVFATNRDLAEMVEAGEFREDLFYRINVFQIHIPPLRERPADTRVLINHLKENLCRKNGISHVEAEAEACDALANYHWPGNIRELENVLVQALAIGDAGQLSLSDLPRRLVQSAHSTKRAMAKLRQISPDAGPQATAPGPGAETSAFLAGGHNQNFDDMIKAYSRSLIREALNRTDGNKARAAEILGIKRGRLRYQIIELEIEE